MPEDKALYIVHYVDNTGDFYADEDGDTHIVLEYKSFIHARKQAMAIAKSMRTTVRVFRHVGTADLNEVVWKDIF